MLVRTFIFTPIKVQQKSMYPTLNPKDIMLLNKIGYYINGVERFDIVVLKNNDDFLIKRIIGLPGEELEYKNSILYVNGKELKESFINTNTEDFKIDAKIPKGKYFLIGDNRNNSTDSRILGFIDEKDIKGKTNFIFFPFKRIGLVKQCNRVINLIFNDN